MSLLSMDNDDFNKSVFFDILVQKQTYWSFIYSLLSIPINVLYFLFAISGLVIGFILIPLWIGVPILIGYFRMLWHLSKLEEKIYEKYLSITLPTITKYQPKNRSAIILLKTYLNNHRTWLRVAYFSSKVFYSIVLALPMGLFLALSFSMIYIPIDSVFGHINFYNLYQTDSYIEVIFIYFVAIVVWVGIIHLINMSVTLSSKMAKSFLCR